MPRSGAAFPLSAGLSLYLTCEHAGAEIPECCKEDLSAATAILRTHRGFDVGALNMAQAIEADFNAPLRYTLISRLVIDCNRSPHHPRLFSEFTRFLPVDDKNHLLEHYYASHRGVVEQEIRDRIERGERVFHLAVHTFTPILNGVERPTGIGLLYDPARPLEQDLCRRWKRECSDLLPRIAIHCNRPYKGASDGFTTWLRTRFSQAVYLGVELEINQRHWSERAKSWGPIKPAILESLRRILYTV
ncbi:MAG: N-formylglutamate amidohydrolase [bacterium]|nr:N-formylglutamate amidohydrolase [bacterium]